MRDALLLTIVVIGAVAAFFPSAEAELAPTAQETSASPAPSFAKASVQTAGATELRRAGDGHFYAPVAIGERPITMLVDTGASVVALTGEDARLAGIHWNPAELRVVASGAGGDVRGVALTIDRMRLGGHEARDVRAVVVPEGLRISLLGQSFLKDVEPVRIERDRMILGDT